ncbi:MAG: hypothetical protein GX850_05745 [Clostridiaceae bacterium]|jgi:hypothetical protein|nr:hypothetical protein [Clostridiaceae bacterium]
MIESAKGRKKIEDLLRTVKDEEWCERYTDKLESYDFVEDWREGLDSEYRRWEIAPFATVYEWMKIWREDPKKNSLTDYLTQQQKEYASDLRSWREMTGEHCEES